ncbi:MAG: hypothetical protein WBY53_01920 [Acidobacteriaceae bacterium]
MLRCSYSEDKGASGAWTSPVKLSEGTEGNVYWLNFSRWLNPFEVMKVTTRLKVIGDALEVSRVSFQLTGVREGLNWRKSLRGEVGMMMDFTQRRELGGRTPLQNLGEFEGEKPTLAVGAKVRSISEE